MLTKPLLLRDMREAKRFDFVLQENTAGWPIHDTAEIEVTPIDGTPIQIVSYCFSPCLLAG